MTQFNHLTPIRYSKVYGRRKEIAQHDIQSLNRKTWARILARLNCLVRSDRMRTISEVLNIWFSPKNGNYSVSIYNKIITAYNNDIDHLIILQIWSNMSILEMIIGQPENVEIQKTDLETEITLFEIYLCLNDEFNVKSDNIPLTVTEIIYPNVLDLMARRTIANFLPYFDLNHLKLSEVVIANIVKARFFFLFMKEKHPTLFFLLLSPYGYHEWQDYMKSLLSVVDPLFRDANTSGIYILDTKESPDRQKNNLFLSQLSLKSDVLYQKKTDFVNARSQPLFKLSDDEFLILDSVLIANKIFNSLIFETIPLAKANKSLNIKYDDFLALSGLDFFEKTLCYTLLEKVFNNPEIYCISGDKIIEDFGIESEPDYYARHGCEIFLFEIKGSILNGESKQSFLYSTIKAELKSKFKEKDTGEPKAIYQLVERIRILMTGEAPYDEYEKEKVLIYPIILVSELALTAPGINYVLNQWFQKRLVEQPEIDISRVGNLTILDIDTLIFYSDAFEDCPGLLQAMLIEYHTFLEECNQNFYSGNIKLLDDMALSYTPFSSFIRDKINLTAPRVYFECADLFTRDDF